MENEILLLIFRGENVLFKKSELINLVDEDWFIKNLLELEFAEQQIPDKLEICEDKNTALSLIETMRYNTLIVLPNVSLDYLLALSHKWCLPEFINKMIMDRINQNINVNRIEQNGNISFFDDVDTKITFQCINCKGGFKVAENKSNSCVIHPDKPNFVSDKWVCCGKSLDSPPCVESYHVMSHYHLELYNNMKKELIKNKNKE